MPTVTIKKIDESYMKFDSDDLGVIVEMYDYFAFLAPHCKYNQAYQRHLWDGKVHLCNVKKMTTLLGLTDKIEEFCKKRGYSFVNESEAEKDEDLSKLDEFIESLHLPFKPRDYQVDGVRKALEKKKCILLSPTGSGKSLIQYIAVRWHYAKGRRIALIVPTISLVEQMYKDFKEYASGDDTFDVEKVCTPLYGKKKKETDPYSADILISTWQSIKNYDNSLFKLWDALLIDECHYAQAKCLRKILEGSSNAAFKLGMTGSLSGETLHEYLLTGLFGKIYQVTTTKELQKQGNLSPIKIYFVTLKHSKERVKKFYDTYGETVENSDGTKFTNPPSYADEVTFLTTDTKRELFLRNVALSFKGVVLVLFNRLEQGKDLYEKIKEKCVDREVFYIAGEVPAEKREEIRNTIRQGKGAILVASVGTCSTGIDIPCIETVILCPSKSRIRNLQSIGRGLRIKEGKSGCTVVDISDDFSSYRRHKSFSVYHASIRYGLYVEQKFPIRFQTVENF